MIPPSITTPVKAYAVSSVNSPSILFSPVPQAGKVFESMNHSESGKMIAFIDNQWSKNVKHHGILSCLHFSAGRTSLNSSSRRGHSFLN